MTTRQQAFARYTWWTLWATVAVILWGTVVRATGSGAGCGSHWPLCNGEVVPLAPAWETVIEFGHRLTSGMALVLVVVLVVLARRAWPAGHRVRSAAWWSLGVMIGEALLGAGLVVLEYVADNAELARGWWVGGHLLNTYLLLAVLTVTAHFADGGAPASWRCRRGVVLGLLLGLFGVLGMSGALTALGDTLFPARDLAEGTALTFSPDSHLFVRLRVWHPVLAVLAGAFSRQSSGRSLWMTRIPRSPGTRVSWRVSTFSSSRSVSSMSGGWRLSPCRSFTCSWRT